MKLLIVGASGMIGAEVLKYCLAHSEVSKVVAFVRRELPGEATRDQKLEVIVLDNFAAWPQHILREHADAAGMIWSVKQAILRPLYGALTLISWSYTGTWDHTTPTAAPT